MAQTKAKDAQPSLLPDNEFQPEPPTKAAAKLKQSVAVIAPAAPPKNMLAVIAAAAANPLVDVQKMKELLAMQLTLERGEQEREFNVALMAAQSEMPPVVKDRDVEGKYKYATLERVSTTINHVARRHGFSMSFGSADSPLAKHYRIVCDLGHTCGLTRRYFLDLEADTAGPQGKPNKTPVQGVGSTMSYGKRYIKIGIFDVVIAGEDNDGQRSKIKQAVATITEDQHERLIEFAAATQCPEFKLVGWLNQCRQKGTAPIESLADLPAARFDEAANAAQSFKPKAQPEGVDR